MVFKDKLRGNLSYPKNFMDYVILKSDGMALYHLGHLVDDSLMHTTCVIRDESWLPSTPLHKQLFEYFNLPAPEYLHTAQILTLDEKTGNARKVSKRYDPWADSRAFLDEGYPSESIIEYLLTIINSDFEMWRAQNPSLSYKDFKLNISKMGKSGAQFDHDKLKFISKNVISRFTNERVYADVCAWAEKYDKEFYNLLVKYKDYCLKMFNIERNNNKPRKDIAVYSDVKNLYYYFFDEYFNDRSFVFDEAFDKNDIKTLLNRYVESYDENDDHDTWFSKIKHLGEDLGFASDMKEFKQNKEAYKGNYANISGFIRMALTSETNTPDLYEICKLLKKDRIKQRIENLNKSL